MVHVQLEETQNTQTKIPNKDNEKWSYICFIRHVYLLLYYCTLLPQKLSLSESFVAYVSCSVCNMHFCEWEKWIKLSTLGQLLDL